MLSRVLSWPVTATATVDDQDLIDDVDVSEVNFTTKKFNPLQNFPSKLYDKTVYQYINLFHAVVNVGERKDDSWELTDRNL